MGLAPVAFGMMGLTFGLFAYGLYLLGFEAKPLKEGAPDPGKTVATIGALSAFLSLFIMAIHQITASPAAVDPVTAGPIGVALTQLFSITPLMYANLWLATVIVTYAGWDGRYVGNLALIVAIYQFIFMGIFHYLIGGVYDLNATIIQIALLTYALAALGFYLATHGKAPKFGGVVCIWSGIMTFLLMIFPGGVIV
ncbi:MAG: hypothetical protein QXP86_01650 [Nitrososphaerota archaeon]